MGTDLAGRRTGIRSQLLLLVAVPIVAALAQVLLFFAGRQVARDQHADAMLWHEHTVAIHRSDSAVRGYARCVERALEARRVPDCAALRAELVEVRRLAVDLARRFDAAEAVEETEVDERVERLVALADAAGLEPAPTGATPAAVAAAEADALAALAERRREEERGSTKSLTRPRLLSERALIVAVGVGLFATVAGIGLSIVYARRIAARLARLHADALRFAQGDLAPAAGEAGVGNDELGELASAFGEMAASLSSTMVKRDELVAANEALAARTRELGDKNDELVRASRARDELLGMAWHELRTPLNSVLGFAELLVAAPDGGTMASSRAWIVSIARSAQVLLGIVNNMLDMVKLEAGEMTAVLVRVRVDDLAEDLVEVTRSLVRDRPIEVRHDIRDVTSVVSDPGKLRQILTNLVGNAAKFTDRGHIALRVSRRGAEVCFAVEDTGRGIAAADQGRVFERFAQLDQSERRAHGGTGLGLPIARRLAELLGGTLELQSAEGRGSTFTLVLPDPEAPRARS